MENYKELVERLRKETYWSGSSGPGSREIHPLICDEAATAITELLGRAVAAERQRDEAMADLEATRAALAEAHGLVGVTTKTMFGVPLARLHQLAEADKAGSILSALDMAKVACALQELNKYKELGGLDHLRELVQADRDGRCVVLPCGEGARLNRDGLEYVADHWNITLTAFAGDDTAKSGERLGVFGVEDAEQALKEVEKNG